MRIGYYTPHIVNWHSGAANARMPMLQELAARGHHIVLLRQKHQRPKPTSHPDLPEGSFTQLNLEYEWLKQCGDPPDGWDDDLSRTDAWMRWNLTRSKHVAWPDVDIVLMEPFAVFPANQLFQMALILYYAQDTPIVMYDMDLGHGAGIMGRLKKHVPGSWEQAVTVISMHDSDEVYEGLAVKRLFEPFGAWDGRVSMMPMFRPEVDLVFVGRDLFRRPRMRELVLRPSEMGVSVRVHGRYPDDLMAEWPNVQWKDEVAPRHLSRTINRALCTIVILQSKQAKIGFYPVRFVDGAISGAVQLVDGKITGVEQWSATSPVSTTDDVVQSIELFKQTSYEQRLRLVHRQIRLFKAWRIAPYVDRIESYLRVASKDMGRRDLK